MALNGGSAGNILVTGGGGYLGSSLIPFLLSENYYVTVYDIYQFGIYSLLSNVQHPNLRMIKGDVREKERLKEAMKDVDAIIHLAAIVGYPACDRNPTLAVDVNEQGTKNIIELLHRRQKLVFASTGSCYGAVDGVCTEMSSISPLTLYGRTKAKGEALVLNAGGVVFRFATLYGVSPRMRLDLLINDIAYKSLHQKVILVYEPSFKRTFLHVKDAARALVFAIKNYHVMSRNVFNVGDERLNMTKLEAIQKVCQYSPDCEIRICTDGKDDDKRDYDVSYRKISKLGFKAAISFDDGVMELMRVLPLISPKEVDLYSNI